MELRDIEYFLAIGAHGHVRRAAESLGLSQPALSKSLRRLEKAVGAKLVERTARGIAITSVGRILMERLRGISLSVGDAMREAAVLADGRAGHVRIGVSPMTAEYLSAVYGAILTDAPDLTISVTDSDNDVMVPKLLRGDLDLVLNYINSPLSGGTEQEHLFNETWAVFASSRHPLVQRRRVSLAELAQERWALSSVNTIPTNVLPQAFQLRGLPPPRVALEARAVRMRLQAVANSNLVSFTSRRIVREAGARFQLKELPVKELTVKRRVGFLRRQRAYFPPATKRLIQIMKANATRFADDR